MNPWQHTRDDWTTKKKEPNLATPIIKSGQQ
jgi:hypothetical protein